MLLHEYIIFRYIHIYIYTYINIYIYSLDFFALHVHWYAWIYAFYGILTSFFSFFAVFIFFIPPQMVHSREKSCEPCGCSSHVRITFTSTVIHEPISASVLGTTMLTTLIICIGLSRCIVRCQHAVNGLTSDYVFLFSLCSMLKVRLVVKRMCMCVWLWYETMNPT